MIYSSDTSLSLSTTAFAAAELRFGRVLGADAALGGLAVAFDAGLAVLEAGLAATCCQTTDLVVDAS